MQNDTLNDLELSHSLINYLFAAFCGKFSWCQVLSKLQSSYFTSGDLVLTKEHLRSIEQWIADLFDGKPLIKKEWSSPETVDARSAFTLLDKLKYEFIDLAEKLDTVISAGDYSSSKDRVALLTAGFARFAYSRHAYISGFIRFAKDFKKATLEEQYNQLLPQANYDLQLSDMFVSVVSDSSKAPIRFFQDMRDEAILLPGVFRSNVHDINQLQHLFNRPFSYSHAEITNTEAKHWQELEITALAAGYWKAYGFPPTQVSAWRQVGIVDPSLAAAFKSFEFIPQEAAMWFQAGIPPCTAKRWRTAGYDLQSALEMLNQGVLEPKRPQEDDEPQPL